MLQAIYTFKNPTTTIDSFTVNLIDNPGVRAWAYAVLLNNKQRIVNVQKLSWTPPFDDKLVNQVYLELLGCLETLESTQFKFLETIPAVAQLDQHFFNRLHRHFTQCCLDIWKYEFTDFQLRDQINPVLQRLNALIHRIEGYYTTPQRTLLHNKGKEINFRAEKNEISFDILPFRSNHSFESADLILDAHILGKTLLESYICDDDPTKWDTSGHVRTSGGAVALVTDSRQQVYQSLDFQRWLDKHGATKSQVIADFPLGNFIEGDLHRLAKLSEDANFVNLSCEIDIKF